MSLGKHLTALRAAVFEQPKKKSGGDGGEESPDQYKSRVGKCPTGHHSDVDTGKCIPRSVPGQEPAKPAMVKQTPKPPMRKKPPKDPEDLSKVPAKDLIDLDWDDVEFKEPSPKQKKRAAKKATKILNRDEKGKFSPQEVEKAIDKAETKELSADDLKKVKDPEVAEADPEKVKKRVTKKAEQDARDKGASDKEAKNAGARKWGEALGAMIAGLLAAPILVALGPGALVAVAGKGTLMLAKALGVKVKAKVANMAGSSGGSRKPPKRSEKPKRDWVEPPPATQLSEWSKRP